MSPYEFETGVIKPVECFKEGWELIKDQYWLFFGITIVGMLLAGMIPLAIGLGAMYCGIYYTMLKKMNREPVEFGDLFKGFSWFVPALIATLIFIIPIFIFNIITIFSTFGIMGSMIGRNGQLNEAAIPLLYGVLLVEGVIFAIVISCIHAFIMFTYPLIVERNLSGLDSFKLSARAAWANLSGVVGLILCQFAIGFVGYLACGIGLYFVLPIMFAGVLVAYRKVFPLSNQEMFNNPPSPSAYREAGNYN
jgi:uncharacterized membrane protein